MCQSELEAVQSGASIDDLTHAIDQFKAENNLPEVETPIIHYHTADLYGRRIVVPAGTVFSSGVHKSDHISVALRGRIAVVDQDGVHTEVTAPDVFITRAGTQRAVYVFEEVEFLTVHHCEEQDDTKVEEALTCKSMQEYQQLRLEAQV